VNSYARLLVVLHDLVMTAIAIVFALALRFDSAAFLAALAQVKPYLLPFIALAGVVYASLSLYASKWRYASLPDMINIIKAAALLGCILVLADYIFASSAFMGDLVLGKKSIIIYMIL
jgi:FlaA1/EpsC-like NDP-sugar epimerase